MITEHTKEVYFNKWCPKCDHYKKPETRDPCNECLTYGWNIDSHKPINFKSGGEDDDASKRAIPVRSL